MNEVVSEARCKHCNSPNVVRFGTRKGTQYYFCKDCRRKFVPNTLPKMKTPTRIVASALGQYYGGMPLDSIQRQLQQDYNLYMSEAGIYKWVIRFSKDAVENAKAFTPKVGDVWVADETMIDAEGRKLWFWDIIDRDTRYLLASHLTETRGTKDARVLMEKAYKVAGKAPKAIITDRLRSYIDAIELTFGADTEHIQTRPFVEGDSTNLIERFHGTLKDRMNVVRGFQNPTTAKLLTDAWLVHYNFFKEHTALGDVPPAQKMGIAVPFEDWNGVLKAVQDTTVRPISIGRATEPKPCPKRRRSRSLKGKHKPITQAVVKGR